MCYKQILLNTREAQAFNQPVPAVSTCISYLGKSQVSCSCLLCYSGLLFSQMYLLSSLTDSSVIVKGYIADRILPYLNCLQMLSSFKQYTCGSDRTSCRALWCLPTDIWDRYSRAFKSFIFFSKNKHCCGGKKLNKK